MANKKENKKKKDFVTILIEMFPSIVLALVIIPILGYLSYQGYMSDVMVGNRGVFKMVMLLLILFMNLLAIIVVFYLINNLYKTDMKKFALVGGIVLVFLITMAIYRYSLYSQLDISGDEALAAFNDFKVSRGILIGYVGYYLVMFPIDKIAKISIENKKKTSK